jgi:murein DD-endopeptidase MepM/ murein hydrolase activator NlpD
VGGYVYSSLFIYVKKLYIYDSNNIQFKPYKQKWSKWLLKQILFVLIVCSFCIFGTYILDDYVTTWQERDYLQQIDVLQYENLDLKKQLKYDSIYVSLVLEENIVKFQHIPLIKPIHPDDFNKDLNLMSGFGMRFHPILKFNRLHSGLDFAAKTGTRVIATGDGIVEKVKKSKSGYGNHIIINHGFGYKSLYAHLSEVTVEKGDLIERGYLIGLVGNTGLSLAPHLHYEIHINDKIVDPLPFVLDNINSKEYTQLLEPLD